MSDPTEPSKPPIPNLLDSLRSARGRGGRRRGRGGHGPSARSHETVVQGTDTDAAVSRLSAVEMGYLTDHYAGFFVPKADHHVSRRLPIINRGTYTRTVAIDTLIESFIFDKRTGWETEERQIISLGAGTDTRPARYMSLTDRPWLVYHEIDFEVTCAKKRKIVESTEMALIFTNPAEDEDGQWWSSRPLPGGEYYCHSMDLRNLNDPSKTTLPGLRTDIPTLVLSECCLCYLEPTEASQVLSFFTTQIPSIATVIYEPIKPNDAFGEMMVSNLAARSIRMPTLGIYREPEDQEKRLQNAGFDVVKHLTVDNIWEEWIATEEKERVDGLEGLDEVEEWKLLAGHYIVVWGSKGAGFGSWGDVAEGVKPTNYGR